MGKKIRLGPGFLITAAFIGPGTVTSASFAGASFGFSLLWLVLISGALAFVLQEMSGRFSLEKGQDLSQVLMRTTGSKLVNIIFTLIAVLAVVLGAAAYEAGNITGAYIGLHELFPLGKFWALIISVIALVFLWRGRYRGIEIFLMGLVGLMSISFLATALKAGPPLIEVLKGLFPAFPPKSRPIATALLGTTVVPYNLFLYSSIVLKRWNRTNLSEMRKDLGISIALGIIITASIVITSAAAFFASGIKIDSASTMAIQLAPLLGKFARTAFCIGLFAAGLSSAITAPYAASWLVRGVFGFRERSILFRIISSIIVLFGLSSVFFPINPLQLIILAQITNGLILPLIVVYLAYTIFKERKSVSHILISGISIILVLLIVFSKLFSL